jgi:hypothetical protein
LAVIFNGPGQADNNHFFDAGTKVALDLMVHFCLAVAW